MNGNVKLILIILGITTLISLIFGIFSLIAYTKSTKHGDNSNLENENTINYLSSSNSPRSNKSYCLVCSQDGGKSYKGVNGESLPCNSFSEYMMTDEFDDAMRSALYSYDPTYNPKGNHNPNAGKIIRDWTKNNVTVSKTLTAKQICKVGNCQWNCLW